MTIPIQVQAGWTDLHIYPGSSSGIVDAISTNLHRPRSSHSVLAAAFAGQDLLMRSDGEIIAAFEALLDEMAEVLPERGT